MTALEQQHKDAIENSKELKNSYDGVVIFEVNIEKATKSHVEVTKEQMKGFAEWVFKTGWVFVTNGAGGKERWMPLEAIDPNQGNKTTTELIELYFEHLNNQP